MNRRTAFALLALATAVAAGAAPHVQAATGATTEATPADLPALDAALAAALRSGGVPGAAVVVIEEGQVAMSRFYGVADVASGRPVTAATVFRAGSISKTLTAVALMQLVEQQRVALDAPVSALLPEWPVQGTAVATLRLAHLAEHSSGLDDIRFRHYLIEGRQTTLQQALALFGPYRLRWAPGSGTAYSNAGPIALGRVIEKVAGAPFEAVLAASVTGPMGMASARWTRDPAQAGVLSASYQADGLTPEPYVETPARPSGSLSITAGELARLPLMLIGRGTVDGRRILQPASVARMERPATSAAARLGAPIGWGLALRPQPAGRALFHGHDGSIDGYAASFAYAPTLRAGYVVMANRATDAVTGAARLVRRYLERALPPPEAPAQPVGEAQRRRWSGQYQSFTPRQELLRAVIGLAQWEGAAFDGDVLRYEGARWRHLGNGLFQQEGAAAPALLFIDTAQGVQAHTHAGARRRVGGLEMTAKLAGLALVPLALLAGLASAAAWGLRVARGRGGRHGEAPWRLAPPLALGLAVAAPLAALALLATGDLALLGRPHPLGWAVCALSALAALAPLAATAALWRARAAPMSRWSQALAALQLALAVLTVGWLAAHGWIGLRVWDA